MMFDCCFTKQERAELRQSGRQTRHVSEAYRLSPVILLGSGRTSADTADALLIDSDTEQDYFKQLKCGGRDGLLRMNFLGSKEVLNREQLAEQDAPLHMTVYSTTAGVAIWVAETFGVHFTVSVMTAMLSRSGYTWNKPKLVSG